MIKDALHLEFVLVVGVPFSQMTVLLCQVKTVTDVFGRYVIFSNFDAVVKISHLNEI